jgi:anaerobic ribonucleoside-triphosphate reductase activating protein
MTPLLRVSHIAEESVVDGPGVRYVIFMQGCPHRCAGCHNPSTHDFAGGRVISAGELFEGIVASPLTGGVTFSGGEPLCQAEALGELAERVQGAGLNIALYTGYTFEELLQARNPAQMRLLSLCGVLIDGRYEADKRSLSLRFRGSSNQRILDCPHSLRGGAPVWIGEGDWLGDEGHINQYINGRLYNLTPPKAADLQPAVIPIAAQYT